MSGTRTASPSRRISEFSASPLLIGHQLRPVLHDGSDRPIDRRGPACRVSHAPLVRAGIDVGRDSRGPRGTGAEAGRAGHPSLAGKRFPYGAVGRLEVLRFVLSFGRPHPPVQQTLLSPRFAGGESCSLIGARCFEGEIVTTTDLYAGVRDRGSTVVGISTFASG
jgi:hypothetical protein